MTFPKIQLSRSQTLKRLALAGFLVVLVAVAVMPLLPITVEAQPALPPGAPGNSQGFPPGATALGQNTGTPAASAGTCYYLNFLSDACLQGAAAWMVNLILGIVSRLVWLAGLIFNVAVDSTLNMNGLLADIPVVDIGWRILRDIANIVFIFIALWSGISITLGLQAEKAWGLLAHMVLVALFINFSLFITKTIVDGTNIAALHFYNLMKDPASTTDADADISGAFMDGLRLQTLYDSKTIGKEQGTDAARAIFNQGGEKVQVSQMNIILVGVFGSIFMVVTAFVFFAAAFLFIIRAITLIMLMVLSPLAFVAWILPGASGLASKWWSTLWSQAFFAPLYMALAYVVVATIRSPAFGAKLTGLTFAAAFTTTNAPHTALIFNFLILIGLMIGCLIVAQQLGGKGAELGMSWAKSAGGAFTGLIGRAGVRGFHFREEGWVDNLGKKTAQGLGLNKEGRVGRFLSNLGGKEIGLRKADEMLEKSRFGQSAFGKVLREQTTGRLAQAKFGGGKSAQEAYEEHEQMVSRRRDIEYGSQAKNGAGAATVAREGLEGAKQRVEANADLEAVKKEGGALEFIKKYEAARTGPGARPPTAEEERRYKLAVQYRSNPAEIDKELADAAKALDQWTAKLTDAKNKISSALARMTTEGFLNQQKSFFAQPEVMDIEMLGADKYNALMASEHFTNPEKEQYTKARMARVHKEQEPLEQKHAAWLKDFEQWQEEKTGWENKKKTIEDDPTHKAKLENFDNEAKMLQQNLAQAQKRLVRAEQKGDAAAIDSEEKLIKSIETQLDTKSKERGDYVTTKIRADEIKAGLVDKDGKSTLREQTEAPSWSDLSIRKALRNILDTRELINYYRYDRDLINFEHFIATVKQGMWNRVRESPEVDAATKENNRVAKRYYIKESIYLGSGLDVAQAKKFEAENKTAAYSLLEELDKIMKERGIEGYQKFINSGDLNELLKKRGLENLTAEPKVQLNRHKAGISMYENVAPNLANDEFEMMPGMLREHPMTLNYLDQTTITPFHSRDIENTVPMANFFIEQFKRTIEGTGKISEGNLRILKWFVNENQGQQFTQFSSIRDDLKDTFEMIKVLIGKSARAMTSSKYATKEAVLDAIESMRISRGLSGRYDPFELIRTRETK